MEVIIYDTTFAQIPEQDNPAFEERNASGERPYQCVMVTKAPTDASIFGEHGFVVTHVPLSGNLFIRGILGSLEDAKAFAHTITE